MKEIINNKNGQGAISLERHSDPAIRRAQRILMMVHELHKIGYQRIRIAPSMAPSGMFWRCSITHIGNILSTHGARPLHCGSESADYTSGQENAYFDWNDARHDTARQLAAKFLERFPEIAKKGHGLDWTYAGWYVQMLGLAEQGVLPVAYGDWYTEPDPRWLPTTDGFESGLPMPPVGEAELTRV